MANPRLIPGTAGQPVAAANMTATPHTAPLNTATLNTAASSTTIQKTALDVTVVIPTCNGEKRLPALLNQLRSQINVENLSWEIIVCDNNSTDDTKALVHQYQTDWPSKYPLLYKFGAQQGAAFARQYAVKEANGTLIAFLDDDNIPADNWVAEAFKFAQAHPEVGAFGSQIHGKFESELPDELENIKCFLAIIERGDKPQRYEPIKKILPPAAGLVVRRQAWLNAVPERLFLNNTGKAAGLASEDLEAIFYIQKSGWEVWYNPDMVVHHDIPNGRLRKDYLVTLLRCVGLSSYHIRLLRLERWKKPFVVPAYIANDIRKLALHQLRLGRQADLGTVDRCNRELLTSKIVSPFFLLKKVYKDGIQDYQDSQQSDQKYRLQQLAHAFETDNFTLYQQPVISLGQAAAPEANGADTPQSQTPRSQTAEQAHPFSIGQNELLLRLKDEHNDYVMPGDFLPTAKRFGLMRNIDRWVIRYIFDWVRHQPANALMANRLISLGNLAIANPNSSALINQSLYAINLSQDSVSDDSLPSFIAQKLAQVNLPPSLFCFEIPAAAALKKPSATQKLIGALHNLGCKVTLDDILINRDTVALITQLPIDYVKLTSTMVQTVRFDSSPWAKLNDLTQEQPVQAIAKGIESQVTLEAMQQQGIRYAQGYQMGRPKPL